MKLPLIAANWKMHKTRKEAREFCRSVIEGLPSRFLQHLLLAPPFTALEAVVEAVAGTPVLVAAQNCHGETHGAFTGEVSVPMLADLQVEWVLLGHSERRHVFGESDALVARRLDGILQQGFKTVLCVGETLEEREARQTEAVVERQLQPLEKIADLWQNVVLAYEPVWAIGTGRVATTEQIAQVHRAIRSRFAPIPILYGGSVNPGNIGEILHLSEVDGALIGGASLDAGKYQAMVAESLKAKGVSEHP